jgi:DNA-binding HxlR family transcriptional regulator
MKPARATKQEIAHFGLPAEVCREVGDILGTIGSKWSILVIRVLSDGPMRFSDLRRAVSAVTQKVLTATLRDLERDGFVARTVTPTKPPRVDYALTRLGRDLMEPVNTLAHWALDHRARVRAARAAFDGRTTEGSTAL